MNVTRSHTERCALLQEWVRLCNKRIAPTTAAQLIGVNYDTLLRWEATMSIDIQRTGEYVAWRGYCLSHMLRRKLPPLRFSACALIALKHGATARNYSDRSK